MLTDVRLVDGDREMTLLPRDGVRLYGLDAPMPEVRAVVEARTDDDGERDSTTLHGARACSIDVLVTKGARAFEDEITRFLHPRSRPYLVVSDDEWSAPRRLRLRVDQFAAPLGVDLPRRMRRVQVQWRVPDGIWEADDLASETVNADVVEEVGISLPITLPVSFAATSAAGAATVTSMGALPSHFVARLYGPCSAPSLINETTGEQITFISDVALSAGDYIEVDTRDRTATLTLNGSASAVDRLGSLDFTLTSWWRIEPGSQQVRYAPGTVSAGAAAVIEYRPSWL